jgi:hypothetical protein
MGEMRNSYTILVGKPDWRRRTLERCGCRREDLVQMNFKRPFVRMWTEFVWLMLRDQWLALVKTVMNFRLP